MNCPVCNMKSRKNGFNKNVQRYECVSCNKTFQANYIQPRLNFQNISKGIILLNKECVGIRSMTRILHVSPASIIRFIRKISAGIGECNIIYAAGGIWEIDEMKILLKNKKTECWLAYALNRKTGRIFGFVLGRRTKEVIDPLLTKLLKSKPKKIYTDGLNIYRSLIPENIHSVFSHCTNKIERFNLTLRTHLKRLSRKTICFSRSFEMLYASINLYFNDSFLCPVQS